MKTSQQYLQEAKEQIVKKYGFPSWEESGWVATDEAALLAIENAIEDAHPKWINVKDEMPKEDENVLFYDHGDYIEGYFCSVDKVFKPEIDSIGRMVDNTMIIEPTHWQPLPSPPKQLEP